MTMHFLNFNCLNCKLCFTKKCIFNKEFSGELRFEKSKKDNMHVEIELKLLEIEAWIEIYISNVLRDRVQVIT